MSLAGDHAAEPVTQPITRELLTQAEQQAASNPQTAIQLLEDLLQAAGTEIQTAPGVAFECRLRLTHLYEQEDNHEAALEAGLQVIHQLEPGRRDTNVARFLQAFGRTLAVIGEYDRAISYISDAYSLALSLPDPMTQGYVYLTLSLIYSRTNRIAEAHTAIANALAMSEFDTLPIKLRAYLLHDAGWNAYENGDHDRAFELIERARSLFDGPWMRATYAQFLQLRGDELGARALLEQTLALIPAHDHWSGAYVRSELARTLIAAGETEAGSALLQEVLALPKVEFGFHDDSLAQLAAQAALQGEYRAAYEYQLQRHALQAGHFERQSALRNKAVDGEFRGELARREQQAVLERNQALEQQQRLAGTIAELSTPVLPLLPGVLVLPVIGTVDGPRMQRMVGAVLADVERNRARALILDITGVPLVDTQVAAALLALARSVKLLGCRCVLVGIRPEIAQALVSLGITLGELTTRATLAEGMAAVGIAISMRP